MQSIAGKETTLYAEVIFKGYEWVMSYEKTRAARGPWQHALCWADQPAPYRPCGTTEIRSASSQ